MPTAKKKTVAKKPAKAPKKKATMRASAAREEAEAPAELDFSKNDALAQQLGAEFVRDVTSGNHGVAEWRDEVTEEEKGGPFVITSAAVEMADGVDESNPIDAEPAPEPTANGGRLA